jgi:hypothetical protein
VTLTRPETIPSSPGLRITTLGGVTSGTGSVYVRFITAAAAKSATPTVTRR